MIKTKDNVQTGKKSKNERISECRDELKSLLEMSENEYRMLINLCRLASSNCSESIRLPILDALSKDLEMLFGSYYWKVIARNVRKSAKLNTQEVLDAVIEHTQNQIVNYMSIRGSVVSKHELMFVFGKGTTTDIAVDNLIDDKKIAVIDNDSTTIGFYVPTICDKNCQFN